MNSSLLVEVDAHALQVEIDLIYAGADNLAGTPIYQDPRCLLHRDAERCLRMASRLARQAGLSLRILDAYRPPYAQLLLWQALPNPEYVRDPTLGSHHSRGVAVDLTLIDADGQPLDMGTGFDDMREQSHQYFADLPTAVQRNRLLLLGIMLSAGFQPIASEWWHYELPDAESYPLIDDGSIRPANH
ncbi:D-alanyl-D-alanine dipeptidase [Pseudomonas sp. RTB3]|uniref:D-alanyl-D-alanine dipeptidase n=1 Tax=unclassified Pseudomonas TaxID=196821 RepID=UPI002B2287DD|nr:MULTISPECIES: D-alanyl-D-alanine dipeptidase [unclassified Pseudomonas]MEB0008021.1 D-alanyl-D-alanine dipeptidase [Pseudomonas sp. RTB2]MEB0017435.1 D-alanyl-D-alanine dipeptidase [Pseudomonas sp. RTB3]MEB0272409.1 D-alanyl-D-alanine dipeptidase [Pseudomonas sp. 5B4]